METIVDGLDRPQSLAMHPVDKSIFIAGASRVIKIVDGKAVDVITDFPQSDLLDGEGTGGALALEFLNPNWLIVGGAVNADGQLEVRGFDLTQAKEDQPLKADEPQASIGMEREDEAVRAQVNSMVSGSQSLLLVCQEADHSTVVQLAKSPANPGSLSSLIPGQDGEVTLSPGTGITLSQPEGYVAFIQNGDEGSVLTFYSEDGEANGTFATGLNGVTAIAYGPNRGRLYLADSESGAIHKLIESDNEAGCEHVEVFKLPGITSMRFNDAGDLLATVNGDGEASGKLVKITGLDSPESEQDDKDGN